MNGQYEVLGPWGEVDPIQLKGISPRLTDLNGKTIGLFANHKVAGAQIQDVIEKKLKERFPKVKISRYKVAFHDSATLEAVGTLPSEKPRFDKWLKGVDAVVNAVGDWGACCVYLVYHIVYAEALNMPQVLLVNEGFFHDAKSAAASRGMPGIRIIPETVPCECIDKEKIEVGTKAVMDDIIAALTEPLTEEEKSPGPKEVVQTAGTIFKGDLQELNQFFYKRGWTDGAPMMPPTEEAVKEMLAGTDLPADHVVARLGPRSGKATVQKIAINAVMAGALPIYMPVLIAAVEAVADRRANLRWVGVSTGSFYPFWIINGPIRNQLHINSGTGALSPGNISNTTIGRAMGLIIQNIGGIRKGMEDMGIFGDPAKDSAVVAENEEESPWEPLHVQAGLDKNDSAVTVFFPHNSFSCGLANDEEELLTAMVNCITQTNFIGCYLVAPPSARVLADKGWTKQKLAEFIYEYARIPANRLPKYVSYFKGKMTNPVLLQDPPPINPTDVVRAFPDAGCIRFIVIGSKHGLVRLVSGIVKRWEGMDWVTQKIKTPKNWDTLVKKYQNLVPVYATQE